jgi:hypothetical protein
MYAFGQLIRKTDRHNNLIIKELPMFGSQILVAFGFPACRIAGFLTGEPSAPPTRFYGFSAFDLRAIRRLENLRYGRLENLRYGRLESLRYGGACEMRTIWMGARTALSARF